MHDRTRAAALLKRYSGPPQSYFMLMPGLQYLFDASRSAVLAYRVVGQVAVALRDPVGAPEAMEGLIGHFHRYCRERRWRPSFVAASPRYLPCFERQGWSFFKLGEEALIDLPRLTLRGKKWQDVRTALRRLPREGYGAQWYDLARDPRGWRPQLEAISQRWLARRSLGELGFTLGTWEAAVQFAHEQRLLLLTNPRGVPQAFVSFVPCYAAAGGWSVDLMRSSGRLPAGAMEYLIATAAQRFKDESCSLLSLSLAPLADFTKESEAGAPEILSRARQLVFQHLGKPYNFRGQARFKAKFAPRWEPRYLVYPRLRSLPRILLALLRAHQA